MIALLLGGGSSNTVDTQVNQAILGIVKDVDKEFAEPGETITFTMGITNNGNVPANNVIVTDTIPNDTTFVSGSVRVNGAPRAGDNPQSGINAGSIDPGQTVTASFSVVIDTVPDPNPIPNTAIVDYNYTVDPSFPNGESDAIISNQTETFVGIAVIDGSGFVKDVDFEYADVGYTLTYSFFLTNTGNVTANDVVFTDTIPNDTTFVPNSFTINGATQASANPQSGVNVGSIGAGQTTELTFQVVVDTIPTPNPIPDTATVNFTYILVPGERPRRSSGNSNTVFTRVNRAQIELAKCSDVSFAGIGDTITYSVDVINTGNTTANDVILIDTVPDGLEFVANSVTVNGTGQSGANPDNGIELGDIGAGELVAVQFRARVIEIPEQNPTINNAIANYDYIVDPSLPPTEATTISNDIEVLINTAILCLEKQVDKCYADVGDNLTYTIIVENIGNISAQNVIVIDTVPAGTVFVPGSVTVGGEPQPGANPQTGISLNTIAAGATVTVTFMVNVIDVYNPDLTTIPNTTVINYQYDICSPN